MTKTIAKKIKKEKNNLFTKTTILLITMVVTMFSCGQQKAFREYAETTIGGGKFQTGNIGSQFTGSKDTSQELELFNKITINKNLSSGLTWEKPSQWNEVTGNDGIRLVSFNTPNQLEVTLISFPGQVGGIGANINRWLGQLNIKLKPNEIQEFVSSLKVFENNYQLPYTLVDFQKSQTILAKKKSKTIIAAIFGFNDYILFVKIIGEQALINQEKENFYKLIQSLKLK